MSYELVGILLLGAAEVASILFAVHGFRTIERGFQEMGRMQKAVAGLVVQESEKLQDLLRT